jgi:hypothetical protein
MSEFCLTRTNIAVVLIKIKEALWRNGKLQHTIMIYTSKSINDYLGLWIQEYFERYILSISSLMYNTEYIRLYSFLPAVISNHKVYRGQIPVAGRVSVLIKGWSSLS